MNALVKALQKFLSRDLTYLAGGGIVLLAFLHIYDQVALLPRSGVLLLFPVAFAYVIGYAIQEVFTLLGLVRTKAEPVPNAYAKWLFRRFERKPDWEPTPRSEYKQAKRWLYQKATPDRLRSDHERLEVLKQVGTTLGPCLLVATLLVSLPLIGKLVPLRVPFEVAIVLAGLIFGFVLVSVGWLKVTQQPEYLIGQYKARSTQAVKPAKPAKDESTA